MTDPSQLPDFILVGAMRSGTSSLARYLRDHPGIHMPATKELHFFDRAEPIDDDAIASYAEHFRPANAAQICGEATPSYLYLPEARERLARHVPDAKLLAIIREPVARAYSHYWHESERGQEPLSFAKAVAAEPERLRTGTIEERLAWSYTDRGHYARQIRALHELVRADQVHVTFFEDLKADPNAAFADVCRFLDVEVVQPAIVGKQVNAFTRVRSKPLQRWAAELPKTGAGLFARKVVGKLNTTNAAYPEMKPAVREELRARFAPGNAELAELLGRPVPSSWS